MSNFDKADRPAGVPAEYSAGAEVVNGTGVTYLWTHQYECVTSDGHRCSAEGVYCQYNLMSWQEMKALSDWLAAEAEVARMAQVTGGGPAG